MSLSIVIPAKNESGAIGDVVADAKQHYPDAQVIVVDDGSTDDYRRRRAIGGSRSD